MSPFESRVGPTFPPSHLWNEFLKGVSHRSFESWWIGGTGGKVDGRPPELGGAERRSLAVDYATVRCRPMERDS